MAKEAKKSKVYLQNSTLAITIVSCVMVLTLLGFVVLSSASQSFAGNRHFVDRQLIWLGVALLAGGGAWLFPLTLARRLSWVVYAGAALLLLLTLVPGIGVDVNGARRWLDLGPMRLQASEFAKIAVVLVMAHYLAGAPRRMDEPWAGFLLPCTLVGLMAGLIILQPDFGTSFLTAAVGFGLLFLAGARLRFLLPTIGLGLTAFCVAVYYNPVRLKRILSFLNVEEHKADGAYQLYQSMLAFAAGGLEGVGVGNGRQQMSFLPEAHTDFIFAVIGEELGFFFTTGVVLLFFLLFVAGVWALRRAPDLFHQLLVAGSLFFIVLQAVFNIGVVTGCFPTKGISLPFISYGGSNLVVMFIFVGLILNSMRSWRTVPSRPVREL